MGTKPFSKKNDYTPHTSISFYILVPCTKVFSIQNSEPPHFLKIYDEFTKIFQKKIIKRYKIKKIDNWSKNKMK